MKEQLIYNIAGENYILVEMPFIEGKIKETQQFCDRHGMIFQGVKEVKRSFWGTGYTINKMLLPEKNFGSYSKEKIY